ncbi:glycoside hydrolase family 2 protein [uncultured Cellulomonas sp.]|uniref:glycoside hydrolase family 2 protein n=1 Tax=uncultured Cellulomonas sp. TaxID=189682 RepID=UPI00260638FA|nr:glycoside hydrolase family 2 protein [uncultured Cellulomonas sp.]
MHTTVSTKIQSGAAPTSTTVTGWTLHARGSLDAVPADARAALAGGLPVPGTMTALAVLVDAGLAGDVTVNATEEDVAWVGATAWEYRATVPRPAGVDRAELVMEGIDTVGRVLVDGRVRLEVADMFRRHVVDLSDTLAGTSETPAPAGHWDLRVEVDPALPIAQAAQELNPLPRADMYELPYNQVRKMACSFGWDWGPVTLTAGLWKPVLLRAWSGARLEDVRMSGGWADGALLRVAVAASGDASDIAVHIRAVAGDRDGETNAPLTVLALTDGVADAEVSVPTAAAWHPVGLGEQPLYDVTLQLLDASGAVLDSTTRRLGFRDIVVRQEPDATGSSFELIVNGTRVWTRGFNWIPPHVLPETVGRPQLRHLITEAIAAGANLLRVWGGGVFESDDFYDLCDELGVMVWQDFPFACAAYPEDPRTVEQVRGEIADAVARLGHRTSLVLWCGCNENLWGYEDWGWKESLDGRPWGAAYYHDILPTALAALDGSRPYVPGSPFSPGEEHPNDPTVGTTHHWDTWNQLDLTAFDSKTTRFAAEFGWQAPAGWPVLTRALGGEPTGADDPRLPRLQKAFEGMQSLGRGVQNHLPDAPTDGRGWYLATQLVQARAVRASIGRFRSLHDSCSGAVWWQLDDCWPALSWSVLDVAGARKLSWYAMREVLSARAVLPTAPSSPHALTLVNDTREDWDVAVTVTVATTAGAVLDARTSSVRVPALGHLEVGPPEGMAAGGDVVLVDAGDRRGARWLGTDIELGNAEAAVELTFGSRDAGAVTVEVRAEGLVRDLVLLAETDARLPDAVVDDQLLTLLPGETATFTVTAARAGELDAQEWAALLGASGPLAVTVPATA